MAHSLANLTGTVVLVGRQESLEKVYKDLKLTGRNKINKKSGKRYTEFGEPTLGEGRTPKGTRTKKLTVPFEREKIFGNFDSDINRHVRRSIVRCDVDVTHTLIDVVREEL